MEFLSSSNFNARGQNTEIEFLILHYTEYFDTKKFIAAMLDPAVELSAHYIVDFDGSTTQLVDEQHRAWHAGKSFWAGKTDINCRSIGIEIANPGHPNGYPPFTPEQISATIDLCQGILSRHHILPQHVLAHSDIAPTRKLDPGELFPWQELADNGIGLWPSQIDPAKVKPAEALAEYGYDISDLPAAITAFQRHFRPDFINDQWDDECGARLAALLTVVQSA